MSTATTTDSVAAVAAAVAELTDRLSELIDACDDPEGAALVTLLGDVRTAREKLSEAEGIVEDATVKAMFGDGLIVEGRYIAERYRRRDRKEWRHDDWKRDVRDKVMRKHGLLNATLVDGDGQLIPADDVWRALADAQDVHGANAPKVTGLRTLGLSADDYCSTIPGRAGINITPIIAEEPS